MVSDVYAKINGVPTAMEVQISTLSMSEIIHRTEEYFKRGIAVLWLPLFSDGLSEEKYSPRVWEKWLHATYFGRVYYWLADLSVIPVHFGEYKLRVDESHWHDEYGDEQWAPGYERISKRWKTPMLGNQVNIVHDFAVRRRTAWQGGKMIVPASRLSARLATGLVEMTPNPFARWGSGVIGRHKGDSPVQQVPAP